MKTRQKTFKILLMGSSLVLGLGAAFWATATESVKDRIKRFEQPMASESLNSSPMSDRKKEEGRGGRVAELRKKFSTPSPDEFGGPSLQESVQPSPKVRLLREKFEAAPSKTEDEKRIEDRIKNIQKDAHELADTIRRTIHDPKVAEKLVKTHHSITQDDIKAQEDHLVLYKKIDAKAISAENAEREAKRLEEESQKSFRRLAELEQQMGALVHTEEKIRDAEGLKNQLTMNQQEVDQTLASLKETGMAEKSATRLSAEYEALRNQIEKLLEKHKEIQEKNKDLIVGDPAHPPHDYKAVLAEEDETEESLRKLYTQETIFLEKIKKMKETREERR